LPKWYEINKAETRQVLINLCVIYLSQLDWNGSNVCYVVDKLVSIYNQQSFFQCVCVRLIALTTLG